MAPAASRPKGVDELHTQLHTRNRTCPNIAD